MHQPSGLGKTRCTAAGGARIAARHFETAVDPTGTGNPADCQFQTTSFRHRKKIVNVLEPFTE
jgi:hypothetical protein